MPEVRPKTIISPWDRLLEIKRAGITERTIFGAIAFASSTQNLNPTNADPEIFGRSLTKPFQMKAIARELTDMTWPEKAISLASHNGSQTQIETAQKILPNKNWNYLALPAALPLGGGTTEKTRWQNPCSGKHAAIVRACLANGWPLENYTTAGHPYDLAYHAAIRDAAAIDLSARTHAPDGCLLPTYAMRVSELAILFATLARDAAKDWIWEAHHRHPELIGGSGRFDSMILAKFPNVLAKEGADGLLGLSIINERYPEGLGIVIKLAHGYDPSITWQIAYRLLNKFGFYIDAPPILTGQEVVANEILDFY